MSIAKSFPTNKKHLVTVIGDAAVDILVRLPRSNSESVTFNEITPTLSPGGTAGNTAFALAKLGDDVSLHASVGSDGYAEYLKTQLTEHNMQTRHIHTMRNRFTLHVTVVVDHIGERHFAGLHHGEFASVYYPQSKIRQQDIAVSQWLHASGSRFDYGTTRKSILKAMKYAKERNIPISLDLNLRNPSNSLSNEYRKEISTAINMADYILGSAEDEICTYTNKKDYTEASIELSSNVRTVIARLGENGCLVVEPNKTPYQIESYKVPVVNTLGAGDVHNAGFIHAILNGMRIPNAVRYGNAAAAVCVSDETTTQNINIDRLNKMMGTQVIGM